MLGILYVTLLNQMRNGDHIIKDVDFNKATAEVRSQMLEMGRLSKGCGKTSFISLSELGEGRPEGVSFLKDDSVSLGLTSFHRNEGILEQDGLPDLLSVACTGILCIFIQCCLCRCSSDT